jgi:hypothetical protein
MTWVLCDKNGELQDMLERLRHLEVGNNNLRRVVSELRKEVGDLQMQLLKMGSHLGIVRQDGGVGCPCQYLYIKR